LRGRTSYACAGIVAADIMVNHLSSSTQNRFWRELSDGHISRKGSFHFGNGKLVTRRLLFRVRKQTASQAKP